MENIENNHVVEMEYTLKSDTGETIDTSKGRAPLAFIVGKQNIVPGLEKQIIGKKVGDSFEATVAPEEGYGTRHEGLIQTVEKAGFGPDADKITVGARFQVQDQTGQPIAVTATNITDTHVTLDANHPLAGETLNFSVEILKIREATEEELSKGHLQASN